MGMRGREGGREGGKEGGRDRGTREGQRTEGGRDEMLSNAIDDYFHPLQRVWQLINVNIAATTVVSATILLPISTCTCRLNLRGGGGGGYTRNGQSVSWLLDQLVISYKAVKSVAF